MKSVRRLLSIVVALGLLIYMPNSIRAASVSSGGNAESVELLDFETSKAIIEKFPAEIEYIEEQCGIEIVVIDYKTMENIKAIAYSNLNNQAFAFAELMRTLAYACCEARGEIPDTSVLAVNPDADPVSVYTSDAGILAGMHLVDAPVGATGTISYQDTFEVTAGTEVDGYTLGYTYTQTFSFTVAGLEDGTTFGNENVTFTATHRTAFAVLYGSVVWTIFGYKIDPATAYIVAYTMLADIRQPTYCQTLSYGYLYFSNPVQYIQTINTYPETFL